MKYPVLRLEKDDFPYVVYTESEQKQMHSSTRFHARSGEEIGERHIDSDGYVHVVQEVVVVRTRGMFRILLFDRWQPVVVEYRYREPAEKIAFDDLKAELSERTRKWATAGDLYCEDLSGLRTKIEKTTSFRELFQLLYEEV